MKKNVSSQEYTPGNPSHNGANDHKNCENTRKLHIKIQIRQIVITPERILKNDEFVYKAMENFFD